jgi:hypothetical protein
MTAEVHSPYPQFFDLAGKPIDGGYIYYGVAGQAPESNPITVYWDAAATIPATQPIRTIAGYPARSGAPANIFVNSEYSVLIKDKNSVTVAQRDAVNPGLGYPAPYSTIALAKVDSLLTPGQTVVTLGYWESYDGGEAIYSVRAVADFSADMVTAGLIGTPDNKIDHLIFGGALVLQLQHNRIIDTAQCGVREGYESGDAWNNAFWRAAALSTDGGGPVRFDGRVNVLTSKPLHASQKPVDLFASGVPAVLDINHPATITAVGGGTFQSHLNAEMSRLTTLHGSTVALGGALAAQFLKADPQIPVFLGDKIERPLPLLNICIKSSDIYFGTVDCDFWCSGVRFDKCSASKIMPNMRVSQFRKYGQLVTKNLNNALKTYDITIKQWGQADLTDHYGRMMPGGYSEPQNFTGDCIVACQKDMMWFGGNVGWSRAPVVTLDRCRTAESDRWAGRTMYPDYFTRWDDDVWNNHGGQIDQPEWDRMAPSTGTGDCNFYSIHTMQGTALDEDGEVDYRLDGLAFGGQPGWENWNSGNPVNVYGADIDSSLLLCFGESIRFCQPTGGGANTAINGIFAPNVRFFPARSTQLNTAYVESDRFTIGIFDFDRGREGAPDIVSYGGDYRNWNARNRVSSGSYSGPVQYRGLISGGTGNLPSGQVTTIGDFFWITEAGTYGGEVFAVGDILYALTLTPGTTFNSNWYHGIRSDLDATNSDKSVAMHKAEQLLVPKTDNNPIIWYFKPGGEMALRFETGLTKMNMIFDGDDLTFEVPDQLVVKGALLVKLPKKLGYGIGAGAAPVVQATSRTTAVTTTTPSGSVQLFTAAGSPTATLFTVNNALIDASDTVILAVRNATNAYIAYVTRIFAGGFDIAFQSMVGIATDTPIINYSIIAGVGS